MNGRHLTLLRQARKLSCLALLLAAPVFAPTPAFAQTASVLEAERAYQSVDFPATHSLAQQALEAGGATRQNTARLYVLLGISSAALGNADEAKQNFVIALAVDPTLKLDKGLSPKIRDPYLEAQGYWAASSERLSINGKPSRDSAHLVVRLSDPTLRVSHVRLRVAPAGSSQRATFQLSAVNLTRFALPNHLGEHAYEFVLEALDRYGNVLAEHGTEADPELAETANARYALEAKSQTVPRGRSYLLPATLALAGLGSAAAGLVFHVKREQAAHDWNGPSCENAGETRLDQCSRVDARRKSDEHWAIGLYAASGALLTGSVIALLSGRPADAPRARAGLTGCAALGVGLSCEGAF